MLTLSASKITSYLQCGRKYFFRYVARVQPPWKAAALSFGSAVHGALETFHEQRAVNASMTPEAAGALFKIDWASELVDDVRFKEDETAEDLASMGEQLVRLYAVQNQGLEVRAAEIPFELPLVDPVSGVVTHGVVIRGVFDAFTGVDRIREMKTAARDFDAGTLERHIQVSIYVWAYRLIYDREPIVELVAMLKKKWPRITTHEVTRTVEDGSWLVGLVKEVARGIETGVFPPNPSWACPSCEFSEQCRGMGGGP